jgi:hypothetical protein
MQRASVARRLAASTALLAALLRPLSVNAESSPTHSHPAPEKLGTVHLPISCAAPVQAGFDRALALLHSFAYDAAEKAFAAVNTSDPACAMAHWGVAMSMFHQIWSPPDAHDLRLGRAQLNAARDVGRKAPLERELIAAAAIYFRDDDPASHGARAQAYAQAMGRVAEQFPAEDEAQIFFALALIGTAPPTDMTHANQKRAVAILEPVYRREPDHPGVAHYLIHACDSSELAAQGLAAARAYAKIAPTVPHALHMPSHIFTRLGLWEDSIQSNEAARRAAHDLGEVGEELHAMDYLTYAYLQRGHDAEAERVVADLHDMRGRLSSELRAGYAATAMPVRLAVERRRWTDALAVEPQPASAPQVAAIALWARVLGRARSGRLDPAEDDVGRIDSCEVKARERGDRYWAAQIGVLGREARAWSAYAADHPDEALSLLRAAADAEDALEKLPVTPGPIVPAREQLGQMLLDQHRPGEALKELIRSLKDAPGRRAGIEAARRAASEAGDAAAEEQYRRALAD